jgi:DNA-binding GntR family transcriptional regulator
VANLELVTPILRRSLHDKLAEGLRDAIVAGEFRPGQKLPELDLCARFGVSRTPMREALKVLATEGLVTLTPNRGASVAAISTQELADLFPIMGALEALAGELAAERISEDELRVLQAKHMQMLEYFRRGERGPYLRINEQIHTDIVKASGNAPLLATWQGLMVRIKRVRFVAQMTPESWREAVNDHQQMIEALAVGDGARLGAILKRHVSQKEISVREALAS